VSAPPEALAVCRTVRVERGLEEAFRVFTEGLSRWFPTPEAGNAASLEPGLGGRFHERLADGRKNLGTVVVWEPPDRVVFTWCRPGSEVETEVDVRFTPDGDGTLVELEHRGFEAYGDRGDALVAGYDEGWSLVLDRYAAEASATGL
jgi:uncharacterized protein YndB with AHSA1/START domain